MGWQPLSHPFQGRGTQLALSLELAGTEGSIALLVEHTHLRMVVCQGRPLWSPQLTSIEKEPFGHILIGSNNATIVHTTSRVE